jgi:7-cyano-7-deazaguanine synthase
MSTPEVSTASGASPGAEANGRADAALVLFSGGQDSSVCLAWALERYARVETVGFDYGQRHVIEMQARQSVRRQVAERFPALGASAWARTTCWT